jgi:Heavy metal associated domain 2
MEAGPTEAELLLLVHHHPGRLRVRSHTFQSPARDAAETPALGRVLSILGHMSSVTRFDANPFTGSLVIEYEPGHVEPGAILSSVAKAAGLAGVIDIEAARRERPNVALVVANKVHSLDRALDEASGGRLSLRTLVPAALFAGAAFLLVRRPQPPRWDNLLYWSYSVFRDLNREAMATLSDDAPPK